MKWLRVLISLNLLWLCALTPTQKTVLFGNRPAWVFQAANEDDDFANGRYFGCGISCYSVTRASSATDLRPASASGAAFTTFAANTLRITPTLGLLVEETRTNVFLNSTAPVTQTINFGSTGNNTLWVNGSGSIVMSAGTATGCGTGTATNGTAVTFNITVVGTCVFTKSGSLNAAQVEAGTFGTSLIVTGAASATRNADVVTLNSGVLSILQTLPFSVFVSFNAPTDGNTNAGAAFIGGGSGMPYLAFNANNIRNGVRGVVDLANTSNSYTINTNAKIASAWQSTNSATVLNGGTVATSASSYVLTAGTIRIGSDGLTGSSPDAYISRIAMWRMNRLPNATLQSLTQ